METRQSCPDSIRTRLLGARHALESEAGVSPAELALPTEAAEVMGALSEDAVLASAVLVRGLVGHPGLSAKRLGELVGPAEARLALDLARLGELHLPSEWAPSKGLNGRQAEIVRKMLLCVVSDPRLVVGRLAEALVGLRHAKALQGEERRRLALEARALFAPLANRLGIWQLKWELEDLAFRYLEPDDYRDIATALSERRADRERYIASLCADLHERLGQAGVDAEVYGRPKHMYSIYRKMQRKQLAFGQLFDVRAVRVVVASVAECYAALGVVHGMWPYIPGEFDDYIATPKDNFYRSIHTAVVGPAGKSVEIQIRTRDMHEHAELGVAAHWTYKEGGPRDALYERKIEWMRRVLDPRAQGGEDGDFVEQMRTRLFEDRIYPLTPKGEVIELPRGATPLDFAYRLHTALGHRCRGARVDGRIVPLTHPLANGVLVEIITAKNEAPSRDWLAPEQGFLVCARSRAKVRAWFRKQPLAGESERVVAPVRVASRAPETISLEAASSLRPLRKRSASRSSPIDVEGVGDLPTTLARCCAPLRPQPIEGYVTLGRGVTIHRQACPSLARMRSAKPERVLAVDWSEATDAAQLSVELSIEAWDRQGLVRDITDLLAQERLSIESMSTSTDRRTQSAHVSVTLAVHDLEHLTRLLRRLGEIRSVKSARRMH